MASWFSASGDLPEHPQDIVHVRGYAVRRGLALLDPVVRADVQLQLLLLVVERRALVTLVFQAFGGRGLGCRRGHRRPDNSSAGC